MNEEIPPIRSARRASLRTDEQRTAGERTEEDAAAIGIAASAPSARAEMPREPEPEGPLRRRTRQQRTADTFEVPLRFQKPGWDYEWRTLTVFNQPVDASDITTAYEAAWRPEKAADWPTLVLPGTAPDAPVIRGGQQLFGRPRHFTQEARQEDYEAALEQQTVRLRGSAEGRATSGGQNLSDIPGVRVRPLSLDIEGEHGSYGRSPIPERPAR